MPWENKGKMKNFWKKLLKPRARVAEFILAFFVVAFFSLGFLDYLQPIKEFLDSDSLAFKIGDLRFSVYLLTKAMITIVILFWVAGIFSEFGEARIKRLVNVKASNRALITKGFQIIIYFVASLVALDVLGIDLTAFAVVSGAIGIGIGFGLQRITSNFISGLILLFEKSVEEGDLIELADGTSGFVRHTGARYTLIETFENRELMIPNEDFITNRVTNWTFSNTLGRIDIHIGVSYAADLDKVAALILEAANEHPRCAKRPAAQCFLVDFGDSSINFMLYFWVEDVTRGRKRPKSDVLFSIWRKFNESGIEIPFPQRYIHIKNTD